MAKPKPKPFEDVEFATEYPGQRVADHEVFMSFTNDDDAIAFGYWWHEKGKFLFQEWLDVERRENSIF